METGSNVLLVAHSEYRGVYIGVARRLKKEFDAKIHVYVVTEQEVDYYRRIDKEGLFASITVARALYTTCKEPVADPKAVIAEARANERELGITINRLAVSDRHLGRGYSLGGYRHPRSRISEETSYAQMLAGFNAVIAFWRREIEEKRPALILNAGKVQNVVARHFGVPTRLLAGARFKNRYYWAIDEFYTNPRLEPAFRRIEDAPADESYALDVPYESYWRILQKTRKEVTFFKTVKHIARIFLRHTYWRLRGYDKAKGYYVAENLAYAWRSYRATRQMTEENLPALDDIAGTPFVFFPLATEPEVALQLLSPEYFYQLPAISSVSRDLPAGYEILVKEHYFATGRRPTDFYGQITEFANVRMMNMAVLGIDAVRASSAVVTITGTGGFEGAALGKPVVVFGRHNIYGFLSHVKVVTQEEQIQGYLQEVLDDNFDAAKAKADGHRFLQALVETSFDLLDFQPIDPESISEEAIDVAFGELIGSLAPTGSAAA